MGTEGNQTLAQYYAECESEGEIRDSYDGMTESGRSEWIYEMMDLYDDEYDLFQRHRWQKRGFYKKKGVKRPEYQGALPEGNNGLGLFLLGITGNEVLKNDIYQKIKTETLTKVRGTVQADILKEDQAQNTCIFSTA